ncbi:MAG: glycerophosphodiester phosphodiesterase [Promethearchaeota archaeon]
MLVIAHRGLSLDYPENTMLAFEKAVELGVDMMELDVRKTKDNKLVISHDADLFRASRKKGIISVLTYDQILKEHDLGMGQKVPLLEDVLKLIKRSGVSLNIEIKEYETEEDIVNLVDKYEVNEQVLYSSFMYATLLEVRDLSPSARIALVFGDIKTDEKYLESVANQAEMVGAECINLHYNHVTREIVDYFHGKNLKLMAWTPNATVDMLRLLEAGVDGIFTDDAVRLKRVLDGIS